MDGLNERWFSLEEAAPPGDEFQVDDLLDLRGLPEPEKEEEEEGDDSAKEAVFFAFEKKESLHRLGINLPEENDAADLEWLSRFVHDCNSEYQPTMASIKENCRPCFSMEQPSPAASWRVKKEALIPVKAKRSKRNRRTGISWTMPCYSSVSSTSSPSPSSSCSCSYASQESYHKKRGRKPKSSMPGGVCSERQCTHCGAQKTPQWRAGPHGPKTLCNACGVRFKSGRLLPEYRPACSPTFISNIHSNKHRKVLEMRRKKEGPFFAAAAPPVQSC
ncbi:GATA transcription factor 7-like [Phalaenopsis equestris]|uniref:GATA transcription factor 7-like n=1 Tax=Phalaenopsis equestris TaxID=78828 RepID=UPI0009E45CA0|nr:GATA transcription factor 7-like [Phalaenopsis equestris]